MHRWVLAGLLAISWTNSALAFGPIGLGLPLLFGPEAQFPGSSPSSDRPPIFDFPFVAGSDESQEPPARPSRADLAHECLKAWRQLIADGRYDLAPAVAAKAVAFDPESIDARHAVVVSQVLRDMSSERRRESTGFAASPKPEACPVKPTATPRRDDLTFFDETTIDDAVVKASLKHMFPGGLLGPITPPTSIPKLETVPNKCDEHRAVVAGSCCSASCCSASQCSQPAASTNGQIALAGSTTAHKRITVKAAGWQIECDRIVRMDEREMILEGEVAMTMRGRDVTVQAGRVVVNLESGTIRVGQ